MYMNTTSGQHQQSIAISFFSYPNEEIHSEALRRRNRDAGMILILDVVRGLVSESYRIGMGRSKSGRERRAILEGAKLKAS